MDKVIYDGWPLVYEPNGPAALHLLTLLACQPGGVRAALALPGALAPALPGEVEQYVQPAPNSDAGRLQWEQRLLPGLAKRAAASRLHAVGSGLALWGQIPGLFSPAGFDPVAAGRPVGPRPGLARRLRDSLAAGGLSRASRVFWPEDLPTPHWPGTLVKLPPAVHPIFRTPAAPANLENYDLPEGFILYHGPGREADLRRLLDAWSWAAPAIGEANPLRILGLSAAGRQLLAGLLDEYNLAGSAQPLPQSSLEATAALYQRCAAVFHPASVSPWGDPLRPALACGKPVVSLENPLSDALAGPAAYLVPAQSAERETSRALGAAVVTVVVDENVGEELAAAGRERAEAWQLQNLEAALEQAYRAE